MLSVDPVLDAALVDAYDAWVRVLQKAIVEVDAAEALVKRTPGGHEQKLPELSVLSDATKQVVALGAQLGRSPVVRARLGADTEPEGDEGDLDLPALPKRKRRATA